MTNEQDGFRSTTPWPVPDGPEPKGERGAVPSLVVIEERIGKLETKVDDECVRSENTARVLDGQDGHVLDRLAALRAELEGLSTSYIESRMGMCKQLDSLQVSVDALESGAGSILTRKYESLLVRVEALLQDYNDNYDSCESDGKKLMAFLGVLTNQLDVMEVPR